MSIRARFLLIAAALILLLSGIFYVMMLARQNQTALAESEARHSVSYKLADELRQSSDDLTRMARTYAVTGDPRYEKYFRRILAIRNGEVLRPENYQGVYWDRVTARHAEDGATGELIALEELMRQMEFTPEEFAKLREAQANSDALVALEDRAMAAVKGRFPDDSGAYTVLGAPDMKLARELLHGEEYHREKGRIMEPIGDFLEMVETRTQSELLAARERGRLLNLIALSLMALALALVVVTFVMLQRRVAHPVVALAEAAQRVEAGDYGRRVNVDSADEVGTLARAFNQMSAAIERDVSERERTAAELADAREAADQANRAKSSFLANMSHELRTPMNAVIGYSEMLVEEAEEQDLDEFVADLRKIHGAGKHLLSLINDVLDLSKIEAGRMDIYLEQFDLREMLDEAVATVAPLVDKNGNTLASDLGEELGAVRADLTKVRQSVFNLLSNAAKFTENGTITLRARREAIGGSDQITLSVSDTGIGIPHEKLGHIFEEFSQADVSTARDFGGTGLGLAISKRFCQMMGGNITVASTPGEGSTFTITLPATVDALEAARAAEGADEPTAVQAVRESVQPAPGKVVLVIDVDAEARELLCRTLEGEGYAVETAESGEVGLERARALLPAAITLDVMMPGMDGWAVLRALKADPALQQIPVVMVSIIHEKGMGYALGAAEYLTKPVDRELLRLVVGKYAESSGPGDLLVVDDDADARQLVRRTLEPSGWTVREAENGRQGLERVGDRTPDLIVLDLMMPVLDGFGFLSELRRDDDGGQVPVLVLTAKEVSPEEKRFLEEQAQLVVQKDADDLAGTLDQIRDAVGRHTA